MLTPGTSGLTREQAMALVVELAEVQTRLGEFRPQYPTASARSLDALRNL